MRKLEKVQIADRFYCTTFAGTDCLGRRNEEMIALLVRDRHSSLFSQRAYMDNLLCCAEVYLPCIKFSTCFMLQIMFTYFHPQTSSAIATLSCCTVTYISHLFSLPA